MRMKQSKYILLLLILGGLIGCSKSELILGHDFQMNVGLEQDVNGLYHMELNDNEWQTLHRISGEVSAVEEDWQLTKIEWESSHYWYIGDTLGYVVHQNWTLNDIGYSYMTPDTSYVTWFDGSEVPTINGSSYSTNDGEINTIFAPVQSMQGDTIIVTGTAYFADGYISDEIQIQIILD